MTGYGSGRAESPAGVVTVELRSVNSRFLDVGMRLSSELGTEEPLVRAELQKALQRGKISAMVTFTAAGSDGDKVHLNEPLLERLEALCRARGQEPSIAALLALPGVLEVRQPDALQEEWRALLRQALAAAIAGLIAEREREGAVLATALESIRQQMKSHLATVESARSAVVTKYREKLFARIDELLATRGATLDPGRLEQEVAIFADKADLSEEVVRLGAHLERLGELLSATDPAGVGRQLEFLNQEILREINTIGSKGRDLEIARAVLDLKNLAESLREQVANIE
jgi:uncharacterized protein (TIGR00255 family)